MHTTNFWRPDRALCGLYAVGKFVQYTYKWKHCESQTLPAKHRNLNNLISFLINFVTNLTHSNIILQGSKVVFEHIFVLGLVCFDQYADYLQEFPLFLWYQILRIIRSLLYYNLLENSSKYLLLDIGIQFQISLIFRLPPPSSPLNKDYSDNYLVFTLSLLKKFLFNLL